MRKWKSPYKLIVFCLCRWFFDVVIVVRPKFKIRHLFQLLEHQVYIFGDGLSEYIITLIVFLGVLYKESHIGLQLSMQSRLEYLSVNLQ